MATFEQRPNGTWRAKVRKKGYPSLSASFDTKAEAQRWATEIEGDMSRSRFVDMREAEQTTLHEALSRYSREVTPSKKGAQQEQVRIAQWLKHPLAAMTLAGLRSSHLAEYRDDQLKLGLSTATVRLNLAVISHLYTVAVKEWGIDGIMNPCRNIRMPKGSKERDRRPSRSELETLYSEAAKIHAELPIIVELAADTAMRRSELLLLRRDQVRGKVAYLEDTKNGDRRSVPLSSRARDLIASLPSRLDGMVFGLRPDTVSIYFARVCKVAGIKDLRFHDLRHEATSRLFERGFSMMEVMAITGHRTPSMLRRYTHLSPTELADKLG
ncbi:site-specific recombinase XerD [Azomonas agilis]|uniref:Site-specific recombinase XerD n=1 Tax=Azomonas agilis TaxID=116849 RepID=A0A562HYJ3_9GAMM|nr:site-specific integrase [Azomonas agilis]TWH63849.1 site-specific recombinase XerD [Azomonas agilis]